MDPETRPWLFLSYTRRQPDEDWAARVVEILKLRYDLDVWVDKRAIPLGKEYRDEIRKAIRAATAVIFLGSSASVTNSHCRDECVYAREIGKQFIPLFIENTSWGDFPKEFHKLQYEQLYRADDDEHLASIIGRRLIEARLNIDAASIPVPPQVFDIWASHIHPPYEKIRNANAQQLRRFVDECSRKLKQSSVHGYHNLNLALLFLRLGDHRRAVEYAENALRDLPGRADAHYYEALTLASTEPLFTTPKGPIDRILGAVGSAIQLGHETAVRGAITESGLPWLLKALIAREYYDRNGLISRTGESKALFVEARQRVLEPEEVDRLLDSLTGLSKHTFDKISALRKP